MPFRFHLKMHLVALGAHAAIFIEWQNIVFIVKPCRRLCDDSQYFAVKDSNEHDVQSHMFRPTITDMQDKYCGNC